MTVKDGNLRFVGCVLRTSISRRVKRTLPVYCIHAESMADRRWSLSIAHGKVPMQRLSVDEISPACFPGMAVLFEKAD